MSERNDGGPAFPLNPDTNFSHKGDIYREAMGASLRDYFAGKALAGMLARPHADGSDFLHDLGTGAAAEWAYRFADAMLKERER